MTVSYEDARRLVAEVVEAEDQLRRGEQQLSGWLRVAARWASAPGCCARMRTASWRRTQGEDRPKLNDGFIDPRRARHRLTRAHRQLADSTLVARRIGRIRRAGGQPGLCAAATPERPMPSIPEDLKRHPCIVYTRSCAAAICGTSAHPTDQRSGSGSKARCRPTHRTRPPAVLDGVGVAYSPTWLFQDLIDAGDVQVLLPAWQTSPLPLHLVSSGVGVTQRKSGVFEHLAAALADCSMCS